MGAQRPVCRLASLGVVSTSIAVERLLALATAPGGIVGKTEIDQIHRAPPARVKAMPAAVAEAVGGGPEMIRHR